MFFAFQPNSVDNAVRCVWQRSSWSAHWVRCSGNPPAHFSDGGKDRLLLAWSYAPGYGGRAYAAFFDLASGTLGEERIIFEDEPSAYSSLVKPSLAVKSGATVAGFCARPVIRPKVRFSDAPSPPASTESSSARYCFCLRDHRQTQRCRRDSLSFSTERKVMIMKNGRPPCCNSNRHSRQKLKLKKSIWLLVVLAQVLKLLLVLARIAFDF